MGGFTKKDGEEAEQGVNDVFAGVDGFLSGSLHNKPISISCVHAIQQSLKTDIDFEDTKAQTAVPRNFSFSEQIPPKRGRICKIANRAWQPRGHLCQISSSTFGSTKLMGKLRGVGLLGCFRTGFPHTFALKVFTCARTAV